MKPPYLFFVLIFIFLILFRYTPGLAQNWTITGGGDTFDTGVSIDYDNNGNVYSLTFYQGPDVLFGDTTFVGDVHGYLLAKFNSSGTMQWIVNIICPTASVFGNVANIKVDSLSNVYVVGTFSDSVSFGDTTLYRLTPNMDFFLAKFNKDGVLQWAKRSDNHYSTSGSITFSTFIAGFDSVFNINVIISFFRDTIILNKDTLVGYDDHIIARFDPKGNVVYSKMFLGLTEAPGYVDNMDNYYVASDSGLIIKYNSNGVRLWSVDPGDGFYTDFIRVDGFDNMYVLTSDYVLKKYNNSGNFIWQKKINLLNKSVGFVPFGVDNNGNIIIWAGLGYSDISVLYLEKWDSSGKFIGAIYLGNKIDSINNAGGYIEDIVLSNDGNIYLTGDFAYNGNSGLLFINDTIISDGRGFFLTKLHSSQLDITVSINNIQGINKLLDIYPNPFSNELNLLFLLENEIINIEIINLMGVKVLSQKGITVQELIKLKLNTNYFISGIYFLNIFTKNHFITKKIIKL